MDDSGDVLGVLDRAKSAKDWWGERVGYNSVRGRKEEYRSKLGKDKDDEDGGDGNEIGAWDEVRDRTCIVIKTGHEVARGRLGKLLSRGWLSVDRVVPNVVAIGDGWDYRVGVVGMREYGMGLLEGTLDGGRNESFSGEGEREGRGMYGEVPKKWFGRGGWRGDKDKNLPGFHLAGMLWSKQCEWFVMLDDDTYFLADNFGEWALKQEKEYRGEKGIYTGKVFYISSCVGWARGKATKGQKNPTFAHGGSGIVINRRAMEFAYPRLGSCIRKYTSCWAGDMQVGLCLLEGGIVPPKYHGRTYEKHFTPFSPGRALMDARYNTRWTSKDRPITFHKLKNNELDAMSAYEAKCLEENKVVRYDELKKWLLDYGVDGSDYKENERRRTGGTKRKENKKR